MLVQRRARQTPLNFGFMVFPDPKLYVFYINARLLKPIYPEFSCLSSWVFSRRGSDPVRVLPQLLATSCLDSMV